MLSSNIQVYNSNNQKVGFIKNEGSGYSFKSLRANVSDYSSNSVTNVMEYVYDKFEDAYCTGN